MKHLTTFLQRLALLAIILAMPAGMALAQRTEVDAGKERPDLREAYFNSLRAYPFGKIPQGKRLQAAIQAQTAMQSYHSSVKKGYSIQALNPWKCIGPFNVGGRINSVAVHPTDGKTLYVGAADGGVWKSADRGVTWAAMMDNANAISMGAVAVDPTQPNTIYAGTGEPHANIDAYSGAGMMKSTDGGLTWKPIGLTTVGAFTRIIVNPANSMIVLAGASKNNGGLYRSEDGGLTWKRYFDKAVSEISINQSNPNIVLVGTFGNGVYRSTDGGKTLDSVNNGLRQFNYTLGRTSVAFSQSNPQIAYVLINETSGTLTASRIYKSIDGGLNWANVFNNTPDFMSSSAGSQGWYNNVIVVKPDNPDIVLAGGINMVRTIDGGQNWNSIGATHPDHHAYAYDPANPNTLYNGNDGGMYRSDNAGSSWVKISTGLAVTQFYAMGIDQKAANTTYGGTQDNGSMNNNGQAIAGGDGFYTVVDHTSSNIIYGSYPSGSLWKSVNGNVTSITNGFDPADDPNWISPIVMDPKDPQVLFNGRKAVYKTMDAGGTWFKVSALVGGNVSAIGISPVNTDVVYAGSDRGAVLVTTNGGADWRTAGPGSGLPNRAVMDFAPSLTDAGTCYIALGGFFSDHIYKTTDYGLTWKDISEGMPDIPATALAIHPNDPKIIYAGTDIGMFITVDDGLTWATYSNGLPRASIADLEIHKASGKLRAATHGRSMWEVDLEKPAVPPSITAPAGGETWTGATAHVISWNGFSSAIDLDYSLDDGATWKNIGKSVAGNVFRWNVVDTTTFLARVRATGVANQTEVAVSNTFSIQKFTVGGVLGTSSVPSIPYGICYDGTNLWATSFSDKTFLKLDPNTLATVGTVATQLTGGDSLFTDITYYPPNGHFFVHKLFSTTTTGNGWLYEMDKNGAQVNRWRSPCAYPIGLAWLGGIDYPYLLASDRNGQQPIYLINPETGQQEIQFNRLKIVENGPRGAAYARDNKSFYHVITDFTGGSLQSAYIVKMNIEDQKVTCTIPLSSPTSGGSINARGVEYDPRDSNVWVSDYGGNIYKVATCDGIPKPPVTGVSQGDKALTGVRLSQNIPNPFAAETDIAFTLPRQATIALTLYDVQGNPVQTLATGVYQAGDHHVKFIPAGIPSGVYTYVLQIDGMGAASRTMTVVR